MLAAAFAALALGGCGGDDEDAGSPAGGQEAQPGGALHIAVSRPVGARLDPLFPGDPGSAAASRQIHEPLVFELSAPRGIPRRGRGLALSLRPSPDRQVWRIRLRRRVRFQDGSPLTAQAVVGNAVRWQRTRAGRRLLPGLIAADAPRASELRLVFDRPVGDLPRRLRSPRLGIVSPAGLQRGDFRRSGTGPYELRERSAGRQSVMARNEAWWGRPAGLGPALARLVFRHRGTSRERLAALRAREVQVAVGLAEADLRAARRDPLLAVVRGPRGRPLALELSVRGVRPPLSERSLSEAWLTRIAR